MNSDWSNLISDHRLNRSVIFFISANAKEKTVSIGWTLLWPFAPESGGQKSFLFNILVINQPSLLLTVLVLIADVQTCFGGMPLELAVSLLFFRWFLESRFIFQQAVINRNPALLKGRNEPWNLSDLYIYTENLSDVFALAWCWPDFFPSSFLTTRRTLHKQPLHSLNRTGTTGFASLLFGLFPDIDIRLNLSEGTSLDFILLL